ncbi:MAG: DUF2099 family protein, partial [Planctomycetota bacterium]
MPEQRAEAVLALLDRFRDREDLHITRVLGCLVAIGHDDILAIDRTGALRFCPLQALLSDKDLEAYVREKMEAFGQFTAARELCREHHGVPYGASEMLMYALRAGTLDAAVTVCDGAGAVVTDRPAVVQGVGARMNGLFHTSPIPAILSGLRREGALVFDDAAIDQRRGLAAAAEAGHRRIAVTVNGYHGEGLDDLRADAAALGVTLTLLSVCNTGIDRARAEAIVRDADIAWACASQHLRDLGDRARVQLTRGIPVFVYTDRGLDLLAGFSDATGAAALRALDPSRQFLIGGGGGDRIRLGEHRVGITACTLPVASPRPP